MQQSSNIILGIDPGTLLMGYCILEADHGQLKMHTMDVLKMHAKQDGYTRLRLIYQTVAELIRTFRPNCFAIEAPFFGKNVQSMLKLGRAQGVAIAAAMAAGLEVCEYSPRKIKQSITGNGNAGKEQVWGMLQQILLIRETPLAYYDASDALAVAVCHHFQGSAVPQHSRKQKAGGWKEFIQSNPGRIK